MVSLFFFLLFLCQNCCVIMSYKIPQSVAKLNFKEEDKPKIDMNVCLDALKIWEWEDLSGPQQSNMLSWYSSQLLLLILPQMVKEESKPSVFGSAEDVCASYV